jgi:hypothetical protein
VIAIRATLPDVLAELTSAPAQMPANMAAFKQKMEAG